MPSRRGAAVEEPRDVRVLEHREDAPLFAKPADHHGAGQAAPDELDRDLLIEFAVGALGEEHGTHAAVPELAHDSVRTDAAAGQDRADLVAS